MTSLKNKDFVIFNGLWNEDICYEHPTWLFVYGDNDVGRGRGGQAIIRDCSNTIGIPTKKFPNNRESSFYTDEEYDINCRKIDQAINNIKRAMRGQFDAVVFSAYGIGTGLAALNIRAPRTFDYLNCQIEKLKKRFRSVSYY